MQCSLIDIYLPSNILWWRYFSKSFVCLFINSSRLWISITIWKVPRPRKNYIIFIFYFQFLFIQAFFFTRNFILLLWLLFCIIYIIIFINIIRTMRAWNWAWYQFGCLLNLKRTRVLFYYILCFTQKKIITN